MVVFAREKLRELYAFLDGYDRLAVAVSGGVDSMTLAHICNTRMGPSRVEMFHAVSPAVPAEATDRVRRHAAGHGWSLQIIEAGEFADPEYLKNPVNRCYFCKVNLYDRIADVAYGFIASGANLDDLGDYRPGLLAARERAVIHPFVEAGLSKSDVRAIARKLRLDDIAELPAQPCLASRIQTGLRVTPEDLQFVERTERALAPLAGNGPLRVRIVAGGVSVEIPAILVGHRRMMIRHEAASLCASASRTLVDVIDYKQGSAFLHDV